MTDLEALALAYHKADRPGGEGEYGCNGLSCPGVQRLVKLLERAVEGRAASSGPPASLQEFRDRLVRDIDNWPPYGSDVRAALQAVIHELDRLLRVERSHA